MSGFTPKMLIMRAASGGAIWQAYEVLTEQEETIITRNACANGFYVQREPLGYTEETTPGWRDTTEWQDCINGRLSPRARGQLEAKELLKGIRRDGPYWLGGYDDWLVCCYSLRNTEDFHGFTPIACWSERQSDGFHQWLVCVKDNVFYVDHLYGGDGRTDYGLKPELAETQTYPLRVFDWLFHDVIPNYAKTKVETQMSA